MAHLEDSSLPIHAPETSNQFWIEFQAEVDQIRNQLNNPTEFATQVYIANIKANIVKLQHYATISTITLAAYDIKRSQDIIEGLSKETAVMDAQLHPRKKFRFKNHSKVVTEPSKEDNQSEEIILGEVTTTGTTTTGAEIVTGSSSNTNNNAAACLLPPGAFVLSNLSEENMLITTTMLHANFPKVDTTTSGSSTSSETAIQAQLFIKNLKNCHIEVPSLLGSVRIEHTDNCTILLGACCTSVYLDSVNNCTIQILSHQLRIHECKDCKLYVQVQSHPIIEDCVSMGFAPYSYKYDSLATDIQTAGLQGAHHWNTVVDFRWHKTTHSPHWYEIPTASPLQQDTTSSSGGGTDSSGSVVAIDGATTAGVDGSSSVATVSLPTTEEVVVEEEDDDEF